MTNPQPIHTAPKDRRILVFVPDRENNPTTSGWFSAQWNANSFRWESGHFDYIDSRAELDEPTHWTDLPEQPST